MKDREARLDSIKKIIRENRIDSQERLLDCLAREGYPVTQATLSRDLKTLQVGKVADGNNGYYYALPGEEKPVIPEREYILDVRRGFLSYEFSMNICVIKTLPGHANSVALALDQLGLKEVAGTIAGDDTIFVLFREGADKKPFKALFDKET